VEHLARRAAGWEDVLAAPEGVKAEVIAGELFLHPRPRPAHGHTQASLSSEVFPAYYHGRGGPGGWWILIEPDVDFGPHDVVSPDLVGFRRERMPDFPAERPIRVVPDWVCEVLSPSTARRDRIEKADLYLRFGVPYLWLVDLESRILEAFEARAGAWVRLGAWSDGDRPQVPPFDAIALPVGSLFPPAPKPHGAAGPGPDSSPAAEPSR
jgi:Uma2 family endonuclease